MITDIDVVVDVVVEVIVVGTNSVEVKVVP